MKEYAISVLGSRSVISAAGLTHPPGIGRRSGVSVALPSRPESGSVRAARNCPKILDWLFFNLS